MSEARSTLPDFCHLPRIAAVCGVVQLVVILVYLSPTRTELGSISAFGFSTVYAQWLALMAALVLCKSRAILERFPPLLAFSLAALLPGIITALASCLVYVIDRATYTNALQAVGGWRFVLSIAVMMTLLCAVLLQYFQMREQWQAQVKAHARASLQALQARINPHFLFNSMNSIAALVRKDPATAETAIEDLSDLFRAALGSDSSESTLFEELQIVRQFLAIEQLRLGNRLKLDWQLSDDLPMQLRMPRLLLQPLFENAVVHGVAPLPEGGSIRFEGRLQEGFVHFTLSNPMPPTPTYGGHGHALASVKQRLDLFFGSRAGILESVEDGCYVSRLRIPHE